MGKNSRPTTTKPFRPPGVITPLHDGDERPAILGGKGGPSSPGESVRNCSFLCATHPTARSLPSFLLKAFITKTSFSLRLRQWSTHYITFSDGRKGSRAARPLGSGASRTRGAVAGLWALPAPKHSWAGQTQHAGDKAHPIFCLSAGSQLCVDWGCSQSPRPLPAPVM